MSEIDEKYRMMIYQDLLDSGITHDKLKGVSQIVVEDAKALKEEFNGSFVNKHGYYSEKGNLLEDQAAGLAQFPMYTKKACIAVSPRLMNENSRDARIHTLLHELGHNIHLTKNFGEREKQLKKAEKVMKNLKDSVDEIAGKDVWDRYFGKTKESKFEDILSQEYGLRKYSMSTPQEFLADVYASFRCPLRNHPAIKKKFENLMLVFNKSNVDVESLYMVK